MTAVSPTPPRRTTLIWGILLFVVTVLVFLPTVRNGFIPYDDPTYVVQNAHVNGGWSWASVRWAFTSVEASNWHPLTWLSHMVDCEMYGLWAGGHHLTNTLLHGLNAVLLFYALARLTGAPGRSLAVAALFALHPLHVESVAWVAERKDVLSTFFWMAVLWVYAVRAERERLGCSGGTVLLAFAWVLFALGLMSKPMLVTLPCVLLLLDIWPLQRWAGRTGRTRASLFFEKIPFFLMAAASSAVTVYAQRQGGAVASVETFTMPVRLANAVVSYGRYLGKTVFPRDLSIFYPNFAQQPPWSYIVLSSVTLLGISAAVLAFRKPKPYLLVGWLWFLGTLVPVIGLVQVGGHAIADRYTYVPLIGVFILVVWLFSDLAARTAHARAVCLAAGGAGLAVLIALTCRQLEYWSSPVRLFRHAATVTQNNWVAHYNLYIVLKPDAPAEAQAALDETMRILSDFAESFEHKAVELAQTPAGEEEAIKKLRLAIRIKRDRAGPHYQLGLILSRRADRTDEAIDELLAAVRYQPNLFEAHLKLGELFALDPKRTEESIRAYQNAAALNRESYEAYFGLGTALSRVPWRSGEALLAFQEALRIRPDSRDALERVQELR